MAAAAGEPWPRFHTRAACVARAHPRRGGVVARCDPGGSRRAAVCRAWRPRQGRRAVRRAARPAARRVDRGACNVNDLPSGWAWTTVGEVAQLTDGPFGSNLKTAHYVDAGPRVVRLQNIGEGVFRDERAHITEEHYEQLKKHAVQPGDVVIASLGDEAPRACLIPSRLGPAIVKADCIRARPLAGVEPGFLMWMLNSPPMRRQAALTIKGIGRPRLGLGGIRQLRFALPPLAEQRVIVAAIEEHLSRLDGAAAAL